MLTYFIVVSSLLCLILNLVIDKSRYIVSGHCSYEGSSKYANVGLNYLELTFP